MMTVLYAECYMLIVLHADVYYMLSVLYAECHICWVSFMLTVTNKTFMLSVIMLSVMAPFYIKIVRL